MKDNSLLCDGIVPEHWLLGLRLDEVLAIRQHRNQKSTSPSFVSLEEAQSMAILSTTINTILETINGSRIIACLHHPQVTLFSQKNHHTNSTPSTHSAISIHHILIRIHSFVSSLSPLIPYLLHIDESLDQLYGLFYR